ncbi:MAG: CDP-glycerol glycerophosphotransferase family protein [Deltaproteobacteria bacterium]|nr:CDP-glycerol glycerophosphotransferase family protein [Deltaproteobacteria bacterium]
MKRQALSQEASRVAFLVHEPVLYTHYANVWAAMPRDGFEILLTNAFRPENSVAGCAEFLRKIELKRFPYRFLQEVLRARVKYRYVVSNHFISGSSPSPASLRQRVVNRAKNLVKRTANSASRLLGRPRPFRVSAGDPVQYLGMQVGERQVRFMYGADIGDGWSLQPWNSMYDLFLCHGPNDQAAFSARFKGRALLMGYPRYDGYFAPDLDTSAVELEFAIDRGRPTLLWMPTLGDACSITHFAEGLAKLSGEYNLIVRPHPIAFRQEPKTIEVLEALRYRIDRDPVRDMNALFRVADAVLCDYGGSVFGAIYLGKPIVLLDVPCSSEYYTVANSSNLELRAHFPLVGPADTGRIPSLLQEPEAIRRQQESLAKLFGKYFADNRGRSAQAAAEILANLDSILGQ